MKSLFTLIVLVSVFSFGADAQNAFPKGSVLPGGNAGVTISNSESAGGRSRSAGFNIMPSIGFAVKENLFLGINAGYGYSKGRFTNNVSGYVDTLKRNSFSYGVFGRYYKPLKHNFSIFLEADLGGNNTKDVSTASGSATKYTSTSWGVNAGLTPGISYGLTKKLQLEAGFNNIVGLGYSKYKRTSNGTTPIDETQSQFNAYTNLNNYNSQLYLGFRLLLQKKTKA
ncbi:MAG: outer membrane beta-barrel protein [Bacteroidetes bacterium]|nr:outer membrane beta-barrel protein [Bacteroidota bacterium]